MKTAKIFKNGRSQAIRLPKDFRFNGNEVFIKKTAQGVLLIPKETSPWELWADNLMKYDTPFIRERNQPDDHQRRVGLDEVFD